MESGVLMVENHQERNRNIGSKSVGSFIKIDSISIDLENVKDNSEVGKCEHFSIREYVSETRKKNWKICWPFALDEEQNKLEEQATTLPPLHVPKFRWWSCQNCQQKIGLRGTVKDYGSKFSLCTGSKSNGAPSLEDAAILHLEPQQSQKQKSVEGIVDHCISNEANCNVRHPLFLEKRQEKEVSSKRMPEKHKSDTVFVADIARLKGDRSFKVSKQSYGNEEVNETLFEVENDMCISKRSIPTCQTKRQTFQDEETKKLMEASGALALSSFSNGAVNGLNNLKSRPNSEELDDFDFASSESPEILAGNCLRDGHHYRNSALLRRKTQKVRLLTDLLCDNEEERPDHMITEDSSSKAFSNASAGVGMVSAPHVQVSLPENSTGVMIKTLDENKKRKFPHDLEQESPKTSFLNNLSKMTRSSREETETANPIVDLEVNDNMFSGNGLQTSSKSYWNTCKNDTFGKKKNKLTAVVDTGLSLVPMEDKFSRRIMENVGNSSKSSDFDVSSRLVQDASRSGGMDQIPLLVSRKDKKPSSSKKKSKLTLGDSEEPSQLPLNGSLVRKNLITGKDVEIIQTGPSTSTFQPSNGTSGDKVPHLSFSSYKAAQGYDRKHAARVPSGLAASLPWQKDITKVDELTRKNEEITRIGGSNIPSKSSPYALLEKQVHGHRNSNFSAYKMPLLNEKQNCYSQVEQGYSSQWQNSDVANSSQKTIFVKECSVANRKHRRDQVTKKSEQGGLDDIPMEIVELMAKNQYERSRDNAGDNARLLEMTNEAIEYSKLYDAKEYGIVGNVKQKQKPESRNGRNPITTGDNNMGLAKQNFVDCSSHTKRNHYNISSLGQTQTSSGFRAYNESQKKPPSSILFPYTGSSCSCAQNCKWNRDMIGHDFPLASTPLGARNTCQNVSLCEEAARPWSSVIPSNLPITCNIFHKGAVQPSNNDVHAFCPSSLHKGNVSRDHDLKYLNLNATDIEKHNQTIGSAAFSKRNAESSFTGKHDVVERHQNVIGSLDPYSNETIPAMHLLSLMDARMQPGSALNMGGNSKFLQRTFPPDHNSNSVLESGVSKPSDNVKHPSNCFDRIHPSEKSHDIFSVSRTFGPLTSSLQHNKVLDRANDFISQRSLISQRKEKVHNSNSSAQNRGRRSQKSMLPDSGSHHSIISVHSFPKEYFGAMVFPVQSHTKSSSTQQRLEFSHTNQTFWPAKRNLVSTYCSINRNPADFSVPDVGNEYMIEGEDLKLGKSIYSRKRPGLVDVEKRKQQKNVKRITEKELA